MATMTCVLSPARTLDFWPRDARDDLRDGSKKMSKSDASEYSRINLSDDADQIAQKVRKAKTDPEPLPSEEKGWKGARGRQSRRDFRGALGA